MISKVTTLQPYSSIGFISISETVNTATRANRLIKEARAALERAEAEMRYGDEATAISKKPEHGKFAAMATWHYEQSLLKARQAETGFLAAEKLPISERRRKYCHLRAAKATEIIMLAENAGRELTTENSDIS